MNESPAGPFAQPVDADALPPALAAALAGGRPIAPLPVGATERRQSLKMLVLDRAVTEPDAAAIVATSGSTGSPKGVVLSRTAITASATATHERLGGAGDWALALPTHYVAGLMVVARTVVAGTRWLAVSADLANIASVAGTLTGRKYVSLVPTQLARALTDPERSEALASFDRVLLGGAAAEAHLLSRAADHGITVVTTYGMSETCGGCVYDGVPLDGVRVDLEPETDRIALTGRVLFSGYRLRPDLTQSVLDAETFLTSDRGCWNADRLDVLGRMDDVVVCGGINVDLVQVERAARSWPELDGHQIAVVGVPDVEWGTKIIAVTDGSGSEDAFRVHLRELLPSYATPRRLERVAALPQTQSGKIDRQQLIADLTRPQSRSRP